MINIKKLAILTLMSLFLVACSGNPIVQDIKTYPSFIRQLVALELAFEKTFNATKATLKEQPAEAMATLKSILIPQSQEMVTLASATTPKTDALSKLHRMLTDTIIKRHKSLTSLESAIESKQVEQVQMAIKSLEETIKSFNQQFIEVQSFMEKMRLDN